MSEERNNPWESLLVKDETTKVAIKCPDGTEQIFELKCPPWESLLAARGKCLVYDQEGKLVEMKEGELARLRIELCVVKTPFPKEKEKEMLARLASPVANLLLTEINKMISEHYLIAKK